ncbi:MAG TPA: winged helix-turn-helix domain-containing protein [Nitrososphaerales archaeon]|nr:winged helix-turn-helix domain-containing protein [Nitrososphaerales archaeon]
MKYRSRIDIVAMILQSAMRGATKTKLMYGAYLSYAQLKEYLNFVQERGLLVYEDGLQVYRLTPKGMHFLNIYEEVKEVVSLEGGKSTMHSAPQTIISPKVLEVTR